MLPAHQIRTLLHYIHMMPYDRLEIPWDILPELLRISAERKEDACCYKKAYTLSTNEMSDILIIQPTSKLDMFSTWWLIRVQAHFKTLVQSGNFSLQHVRNITGWFFKLNFFRRRYKSNNEKTFIAANDETLNRDLPKFRTK